MTISKTAIALFLAFAALVLIFTIYQGCGQAQQQVKLAQAHQQLDSAKAVLQDITTHYQQQAVKDSAGIAYLTRQVDSFKRGWDNSKTEIIARDKRITSLNADYKAARSQKDTVTSLAKCDSLSNENDSLHVELWTAGRRVDSLLFVNDDLKNAQDTALSHCTIALKATQGATRQLITNYESMLKYDQQQLRKSKTKGWLQTGLGAIIGYAIKAIL